MALLDEIRARRDEILSLAKTHGVKNVRIFGSVLRMEESIASDIDLLVSMESGRSLLDFVGFQQDTEELLKHKVDVVDEEGIYHQLKDIILKEAKPL